MPALIQRLRDTFAQTQTQMTQILEGYEDPDTEISEADQANLTELKATAARVQERIAQLAEIDAAAGEVDTQMGRSATGRLAVPGATQPQLDSIGAQFCASEQFAAWKRNGRLGAMSEFATEFTLVKSVDGANKPLGGITQVRDAATPPTTTPILDSFAREETSTNGVWWLEWPGADPEAAVVAEGGRKPEAAYAPTVREGTCEKWAHTLPVTEEALEDVPRMQSILEGALTRGVRKKAEKQAAALIAAGVGYLTLEDEAETLVAAIRMGIATVVAADYVPTTVYLNPFDYAGLDLALMAATLTGAVRNVNPWGINYVQSAQFDAGTAYVADAQEAFLFIDRNNLNVAMTDSHGEEFADNIYRLRGEARGKSVIQRPGAVCQVSVAAGGGLA